MRERTLSCTCSQSKSVSSPRSHAHWRTRARLLRSACGARSTRQLRRPICEYPHSVLTASFRRFTTSHILAHHLSACTILNLHAYACFPSGLYLHNTRAPCRRTSVLAALTAITVLYLEQACCRKLVCGVRNALCCVPPGNSGNTPAASNSRSKNHSPCGAGLACTTGDICAPPAARAVAAAAQAQAAALEATVADAPELSALAPLLKRVNISSLLSSDEALSAVLDNPAAEGAAVVYTLFAPDNAAIEARYSASGSARRLMQAANDAALRKVQPDA